MNMIPITKALSFKCVLENVLKYVIIAEIYTQS